MFKRKRLWIIPITIALVAVTGIFAAPGSMHGVDQSQVALAAGPEQSAERPANTPVVPKYPPPSVAGQSEGVAQEGGESKTVSSTEVVPLPANIWHRSTLWPAYKDGADAVGKARSECGCAGCWFPLDHNVRVWLWNAQPGGEWELVASGYYGACCPPRCDIFAFARYENAETAWYCTTSRHEGYYMMEPVWTDILDTSDNPQWLVF